MARPRQNSKARAVMAEDRRGKQKTQRRGHARVNILCTSHQLTMSCHIYHKECPSERDISFIQWWLSSVSQSCWWKKLGSLIAICLIEF